MATDLHKIRELVLLLLYSFDIYPNKLKNRDFANAESPRFDSEKTSPLLDIGAVFSESKMGLSAKAKTDSSACLGITFTSEDELISLLKEECKVSRSLVETALTRAKKIVASMQHVNQLLEKMSHSYSVERLHAVERNILRLGIFELAIEKELPPKVALAEAKRLAKKFSTDEAAIFVQTLLVALCAEESIEI